MAYNLTFPKKCSSLGFSSEEIMHGRVYHLTAFIVGALLVLPSAFCNLLLLRSMYLALAFRKPSTLLLYNLSVSDLLIAVGLLPVYLTKRYAELTYDFELFCDITVHGYVFGYLFSSVSLFTVTALSIDRFLIIHKGMHYSEYVTKTKVKITVAFIWIFSTFLGSLVYFISRKTEFIVAGIVISLCFFVTIAFHCKMLLKLRRTKREASQLSESATEIPSIPKYRKVSVTMLILFMVFIFCYLPVYCTIIAINIIGDSRKGAKSMENVGNVITFMRIFINPVILLCRTSEIKEAAIVIIRRISPC